MKRACLALTLAWPLAGCAHFALSVPTKPAQPAQAVSAEPVCPGSLRADLLPQPPVPADAGFPAAVSDSESLAVSAYLTWLAELARWGRQGWARAADAKSYCETAR